MQMRLVEEFGTSCFAESDDGRLLYTTDYTDMDNLVTWILTFGDKVEVLEPENVREQVKTTIEAMRKNYRRRK